MTSGAYFAPGQHLHLSTYSLSTYDHFHEHRSTELAAIFVGKLTSLSAAT